MPSRSCCVLSSFFLLAVCCPLLAQPAIPNLPPTFEKNLGQVNSDVLFLLRRGAAPAALLGDRAVFSIGDSAAASRAQMRWLGANRDVRVEGLDKTVKTTDYFIGADPHAWVHNVPSYDRVRYFGVYDGIDLEFHRGSGELEYDFIVAPGADPSPIRLSFEGGAKAALAEDGSLELTGQGGVIQHRKPRLYQLVAGRRKVIDGRFVEEAPNQFRFEIGDYDRRLALVVDPIVIGARRGGSGIDSISAVRVVSADELVAIGTTDSIDAIANLTPPSGRNVYALHMRGVGSHPGEFTTLNEAVIGGSGDDLGVDVIRGPQSPAFGGNVPGQVVIGGTTDSSDFPFGSPLGGKDAFIGMWTPGEPYLIGVRFGRESDDRFGGFAQRYDLGIRQNSIYDYDGDGNLEFFTDARIGTDTSLAFVQYRGWNADTFEVEREDHVFSTEANASIRSTRLQWRGEANEFLALGTATGSLFPTAMHPGVSGCWNPFIATLPINGPSNDSTPKPVQDSLFFGLPNEYVDLDLRVKDFTLPPIRLPNEPARGYVAAEVEEGTAELGRFFSFDFKENLSLKLELSYANAVPKSIAFNRVFNLASAMEITQDDQRLGGYLELTPDFDIFRQETIGELSAENRIRGGSLDFFGNNMLLYGVGDKLPITSGSMQIGGTSDAWLGRVEVLNQPPDGVVTAGQFQWGPLVPYGLHTAFFNWPRISSLQVLGPVNGAYPTVAQGMQVLVNDVPSPITAINGSQVNFIADYNVNMQPMASVKLVYDDPVDAEHFESNTVWLPTADRWTNLFEANGFAAATHSKGSLTPNNPLPDHDVLVTYVAGGGSLGDDSIGAGELTPGDKTFSFAGTPPMIQAKVDGGPTFDLSIDYFGNSPGSTPALGQLNIRFPEEFWTYCAQVTNVDFMLTVTDSLPQGEFVNPLGHTVTPISDTQAFATCP